MLHKIYTNIYYKNRTVTKYFKNLKVFTNKFKSQSGGSNLKIKYDNAEYIFEKMRMIIFIVVYKHFIKSMRHLKNVYCIF